MYPTRGCIPAGGTVPITLELCANEEKIFDSWLKINLREGKTMSLRVAGSVEAPKVYINMVYTNVLLFIHFIVSYIQNQFNFGSIYCGATMCLPFTLHNTVS